MKLISSGAEAELLAGKNTVIKRRIRKDYRIPEIDLPLRKSRTKREAKVISTLNSLGLAVPQLKEVDTDDMIISMSLVKGKKARDVLNSRNYGKICKKIGENVAKMHSNGIIHGDLTTSNMIIEDKTKRLFMIDFGLSFFSVKTEDKAVDIHLFKQALQSKHHGIWEKGFRSFLLGYRSSITSETGSNNAYKDIASRLEKVEQRGRNKKK